MRILVLTRYGMLGSSSRVRFYQYFPYLQSQGMELHSAPLLDDDYVRLLYGGKRAGPASVMRAYAARVKALAKSGSFDLLWLEKELFPWLPAVGERLLALRGIPYVVDYDDALFHIYDRNPRRLVRLALGHKIDVVMRKAAMVVAGNPYLAERARAAGAKRVEILPSVVDVPRYPLSEASQGKDFRVGWIGSPVTAPFLGAVKEPLEALAARAGTSLVLIGAGEAAPRMEIPTERLGWSEENETALLQGLDAGIMPLPDDPFARGKCGYKLIQYMAAGLPVVASPVGVNSQIVEQGVNGFLASTRREWEEALEALQRDPELRKRMGQAGRRKAEAEYNLQVTGPRLVEMLRGA